jgi:hypothetical protein
MILLGILVLVLVLGYFGGIVWAWLAMTGSAVFYSGRLVRRYLARYDAARELKDARRIVARDALHRELVRFAGFLLNFIVGVGAIVKAPGLAQLLIGAFGLLLMNSWLENRSAERLDRILETPNDSYQ